MVECDTKPGTRNPKHPIDKLRTGQIPAGLTYRFKRPGEERAVCDLVHRAFDLSVAPLYTKKGPLNFKKYVDPEEMSRRVQRDHIVLLALAGTDIVGMIEVRRHRHISLFFVQPEYQNRGIGGNLLTIAIKVCRSKDPELRAVTVNSSPNAVGAYGRMGFAPTGVEQVISGVRFAPMKKELEENG